MTVAGGTRLGPYEVVSALGSGGMGEVWRARDARLDREVAIKLLPEQAASDAARLKRFEKEARAASALNHPNIVTIYAVDRVDSTTFIVMELVEGKTLREVLADGALPTRKLLAIASQFADGLAKAHACGIVHRDLKPENVMVTRDGLVKILDFGLAKLAHPERESGQPAEAATVSELTAPGIAMGTVGYMSPEQAAGHPVDFHSDQFSFGSVLYELVTGQRPFQGKTAPETLAAIIREDPPPIASLAPASPASLRWILERCLAKEPKERYTSTEDLAKDLQSLQVHLSELSTPSGGVAPVPTAQRGARIATAAAAALILSGVLAGGLLLGRLLGRSSPPFYHQLSYKSGVIASARFAPDGRTILYGAAWGNDPLQGFVKRPESLDASPLGPPEAAVVAVSPSGEVALVLDCKRSNIRVCRGTLATIPLAGGAPRELYENVQQADWAPDGSALALVSQVGKRNRLEFPPGNVLYETPGYVSDLRFSPKGDAIAFFDHPQSGNGLGLVAVVDLSGKKRTLTPVVEAAGGLAWSPSGKEIWFSANVGADVAIYAVNLSGRQRLVARAPEALRIHDVFRDGRALVSQDAWENRVFALAPGETRERELTWLGWTTPTFLSVDGRTLLFSEQSRGYYACLRGTDGSPIVRLGEGHTYSLSADGKWALVRQFPKIGEHMPRLAPYVLIPTGVGESRRIVWEGIEEYRCCAAFLPDGKEILFLGRRGQDFRFYRGSREGGTPRPATPPADAGVIALTSDGRRLLARSNGVPAVFSLDKGPEAPPRPLPGATAADRPIVWSDDGHSVYLQNSARVFRVDAETGRRTLWKEIAPADPAGATVGRILLTPDGKSYAYTLHRDLSKLYLVEGLK